MDKIKILLVLPNYALLNQIKSGRFNIHNPKEKEISSLGGKYLVILYPAQTYDVRVY